MADPFYPRTPSNHGEGGTPRSPPPLQRRIDDQQPTRAANDWRCCACKAVHSPSVFHCRSVEAPCRHLLCGSCTIERGTAWDLDDPHQNRAQRDIWQCCKCRIRGNSYEEGVGEDRCRSSYGSRCTHARCYNCESISAWQDQRWREHYATFEQRRMGPGFPHPRVRLAELYNTTIDRYEGPDLWGTRELRRDADDGRPSEELPRRYGRGAGSGPGPGAGAGSCRDNHRWFGGRH